MTEVLRGSHYERLRRMLATFLAVAMLAAVAWAGGAKLVVSWKNPAYTGAKPKRVLVIGMSENPAIRADFEDDMAVAITADGVEVTPGNHILLRPDSPDMDEKYLKGQIRDFKIDGALVQRAFGQRGAVALAQEIQPGRAVVTLGPQFGIGDVARDRPAIGAVALAAALASACIYEAVSANPVSDMFTAAANTTP